MRLPLALLAAALAATPAAAQYSGGVVRLGVLTDMSGPYADLAGEGSVVAAQLAVEEFGGKLGDTPIEIVSADHQNKADVAANLAREWIDTGGVDGFFDLVNSAASLAVQGITRDKGVAHINAGSVTTALTNEQCSPTGVAWVIDTYALANGTARAMVAEGADTWFIIGADYAFGHALADATSAAVENAGGKVLGAVFAPFPNQDFSSYLLQAQASGAKVIALANGGLDTVNAIKQAKEFGITPTQKLAALLMAITDVHALGLETTGGLTITEGFYWDRDERSRAFADRFAARRGGARPSMIQAGVYSSVLNYLRAAQQTGTDDGKTVVDAMKAATVDDAFAQGGKIRADGRMVHDLFLVEIKSPADSKGPWDYYRIVRTIPGDDAFLPLAQSKCPLVTK